MKKILCSLLCSAAIAAASPIAVSYVNPGTPGIVDGNNDYVGPYTLAVAGKNVQAMCMDDFFETSGSWSANLTVVPSGNLANTYLGNKTYTVAGSQFSGSQVYLAEAYLFNEIVQPGADRVHVQDAAWTIMDYITGHTLHSNGDTAVNAIIADVATNSPSFNASNYEILSQVNPGTNAEQEFIVATPEPSTWGLLGGALLLLGVTRIWSKRRKQTAVIA